MKRDLPQGGPAVDAVTIQGARAVPEAELAGGLATAESPRFLGIWDGVVFDYEVLDEDLLARDLERVERRYRARGYYEAKVTAARVIAVGPRHVRVEVRVHEGLPVRIEGFVSVRGIEQLPFDVAIEAERARTLERGDIFTEDEYKRNKDAILTALADRGYAFARVDGRVQVDIARHAASVEIVVTPGPRARYGAVRILGLTTVPEDRVRGVLSVEEGRRYSRAELEDARTALVNLGVFGRVDLRQDLGHPESGVVPLTVVVDEAPLRTLRVGGGTRFDVLEWSSHLTFAWEHRNFLGGLRRFSVESRPGLVFFPTRIDNLVAPTEVLPRNRVRAELRQPSFLEGRTTGLVATEFNVYPVLYPGAGLEGENVIGYVEVKGQGALERSFLGHHVYVSPSMNWQGNTPFAYVGEARLDPVQVSYPAVRAVLDLRNDAIEPRRGLFLAASFEAAGGPFGGDADDVRVQPDLRTYVPISPEVTFATRATVGFLFPRNYGSTLEDPTANLGSARALRDQQLLLLRAFYSGGPSSNRGYAFRGVGPQGPLGFLLPSTARCDLTSTDPLCFRPLGGLSLWEASFEVRYPVLGPLRGAVFLDASDVSREVASIGFQVPHLSPGLGLRYGTPVGPLRLDVGYRLPFVQRVGERGTRRDEGDPGTVAGLPIAIHFGLGEAF